MFKNPQTSHHCAAGEARPRPLLRALTLRLPRAEDQRSRADARPARQDNNITATLPPDDQPTMQPSMRAAR